MAEINGNIVRDGAFIEVVVKRVPLALDLEFGGAVNNVGFNGQVTERSRIALGGSVSPFPGKVVDEVMDIDKRAQEFIYAGSDNTELLTTAERTIGHIAALRAFEMVPTHEEHAASKQRLAEMHERISGRLS